RFSRSIASLRNIPLLLIDKQTPSNNSGAVLDSAEHLVMEVIIETKKTTLQLNRRIEKPKTGNKQLNLNSEIGRGSMGSFCPFFVLKLQTAEATSAKLRCRKLRHFPTTGCIVANRPKKTTDGKPNNGPRDRVEPHRGTLECA